MSISHSDDGRFDWPEEPSKGDDLVKFELISGVPEAGETEAGKDTGEEIPTRYRRVLQPGVGDEGRQEVGNDAELAKSEPVLAVVDVSVMAGVSLQLRLGLN